MRFTLIDRIGLVEPGKSIRAVKNLTLGEEYLADHFPTFPIMPGVLMLQSLVEAGAWLLRITDNFKYSMVVLREAKSVKYGQLMEPGRRLDLALDVVKRDGANATLKGKGTTDGKQPVSAQIVLQSYNLRDRTPALQDADELLVDHWRKLFRLLCVAPGRLAEA